MKARSSLRLWRSRLTRRYSRKSLFFLAMGSCEPWKKVACFMIVGSVGGCRVAMEDSMPKKKGACNPLVFFTSLFTPRFVSAPQCFSGSGCNRAKMPPDGHAHSLPVLRRERQAGLNDGLFLGIGLTQHQSVKDSQKLIHTDGPFRRMDVLTFHDGLMLGHRVHDKADIVGLERRADLIVGAIHADGRTEHVAGLRIFLRCAFLDQILERLQISVNHAENSMTGLSSLIASRMISRESTMFGHVTTKWARTAFTLSSLPDSLAISSSWTRLAECSPRVTRINPGEM
nr:MAG TPA: hypothetical protein [Caudoviricetes sp.]